MKRARVASLRVFGALLVAAFAASVVGGGSGRGAGTVLTGCNPCEAHVGSTSIEPPLGCLTVTADACSLGGETLRVDNACSNALVLTSGNFEAEGTLFPEAGKVPATVTIAANTTAELIAGPSALDAMQLSASGTLDGEPVTILVTLVLGPAGEGGVDAKTDQDAAKTRGQHVDAAAKDDAEAEARGDAHVEGDAKR